MYYARRSVTWRVPKSRYSLRLGSSTNPCREGFETDFDHSHTFTIQTPQYCRLCSSTSSTVEPYEGLVQVDRGSSSSDYMLDIVGDLQSLFPKFSAKAIAFVHKLTGENVSESCDILLNGPSAASIIKYLRKQIDDVRSVDLVVKANNVWSSGIMYYKNSNVALKSSIVTYQGSPAIDIGGLRRHFFTTMLNNFT